MSAGRSVGETISTTRSGASSRKGSVGGTRSARTKATSGPSTTSGSRARRKSVLAPKTQPLCSASTSLPRSMRRVHFDRFFPVGRFLTRDQIAATSRWLRHHTRRPPLRARSRSRHRRRCSHPAGRHYDLSVGSRKDTSKVAPERKPMRSEEIAQHLRQVGQYLHADGLTGEIMIVGGAYMTLVLRQREATKDVDAYFGTHAQAIRAAAARVAREQGLPVDWLNDAVKGFLNAQPETTTPWAEFPGLRVYAPDPAYIFAMKALAGRPEDQRDLRALRGVLGLASAACALEIVARYVPARLLTPRVQYVVEELFDD